MAKAATVKSTRNKSIWIWVIELLSLLTGASFLASSFISAIIFQIWELNFFGIATPSDVIMSGIGFLIYALPLSLTVFMGYRFILFQESLFMKISFIFVFLFVFPMVIAVNLVNDYLVIIPTWTAWLSDHSSSVLYILAMMMGILCGSGLREQMLNPTRRTRFVTGFFGSVAVITGLATVASNYAFYGFEPTRLSISPAPTSCQRHKVFWIGEQSLVLRCADGDFQVQRNYGNIALVPKQSAILIPEELRVKNEYRKDRNEYEAATLRTKWRKEEEARLNLKTGKAISIAEPPTVK